MEARRQRITEMVKLLLPCVEESRRMERIAKNTLLICCLLFAITGGYIVHENTRTIDTNEYTILSSVIYLSAAEQNTTPENVTWQLAAEFHINHVQDLKAKYWNDALRYLATKRKS